MVSTPQSRAYVWVTAKDGSKRKHYMSQTPKARQANKDRHRRIQAERQEEAEREIALATKEAGRRLTRAEQAAIRRRVWAAPRPLNA